MTVLTDLHSGWSETSVFSVGSNRLGRESINKVDRPVVGVTFYPFSYYGWIVTQHRYFILLCVFHESCYGLCIIDELCVINGLLQ